MKQQGRAVGFCENMQKNFDFSAFHSFLTISSVLAATFDSEYLLP